MKVQLKQALAFQNQHRPVTHILFMQLWVEQIVFWVKNMQRSWTPVEIWTIGLYSDCTNVFGYHIGSRKCESSWGLLIYQWANNFLVSTQQLAFTATAFRIWQPITNKALVFNGSTTKIGVEGMKMWKMVGRSGKKRKKRWVRDEGEMGKDRETTILQKY